MAKLNKFVMEYILNNYRHKTPAKIYQELNKYTKYSVTLKDVIKVILANGGDGDVQVAAPTPPTPRPPLLAKTTVTHQIDPNNPSKGVVSMMTETGSQHNDEHKKRRPKSSFNPDFIMNKNKK
jgi:hypothetical protein